MKYYFFTLTICCLLFSGNTLSAQNGSTGFGIKGGVNFATLAVDEDEIDDAEYKTGYTIGLFNNVPLTRNLSLQNELLYTSKGAEYQITGRDVDASLGYLEAPLSLQLHLGDLPVYVFGGVHVSYLLNAKYEYSSEFFDSSEEIFEFDDMDGFKRFEFGVQGGAGVQINRLFIEARLTRGLSNVEDDRTVGVLPLEGNSTKNFGVQLTVGFGF